MFDTLRYNEELEKAGFTKEQARVSIKLLVNFMDSNFATKTDLNILRKDFGDLRNDLDKKFLIIDHRFETLEFKLIVKLGSLMVLIQAAFVTLAKYL